MFSKLSLSLICCKEYSDDKLIKSIYGIFSDKCEVAVQNYMSVCYYLFSENLSLSDYIFLMLVGNENRIIDNYISLQDESLLPVIKNDISVFSDIACTDAVEIIYYLKNKFNLDGIELTEYVRGDKEISVETVISFKKQFGSPLFAYNKAFVMDDGVLKPSIKYDCIKLSDLKNYFSQRQKVIDNTLCLVNGKKAQNALLYGDRGTGKSSTVKAVVNEYPMLRIIQIAKDEIVNIPVIYDVLRNSPLKFILFIDDITFNSDDENYSFLKQLLDGSIEPLPSNCVIYATTNRRHIIKESESERNGSELHIADVRDENMSLSDRFGLYITFLAPGRDEYLDIVKQIAADRKIDVNDDILAFAERFALKKCARSPRTAKQFVNMLESRLELGLEFDNV